MNDAPPHRRWPTISLAVLAAAALAACLILAVTLYLPTLATDHLPTALMRRLGFTDFSGRVTRIGLHQASAGPLFLGRSDRPAVVVQSMLLDYAPATLRRSIIRRLRISGVTINVDADAQGWRLPGRVRQTAADGNDRDRSAAGGEPAGMSDLTVQQIEIRGGVIVVAWNDGVHRVPFEADLRPEGPGLSRLAAEVRLHPGDQPLTLTARTGRQAGQVDLQLTGEDVRVERFADLFHRIFGLDLSGRVDFNASARLDLAPPSVSDVTLSAAWKSGRLNHASVVLAPSGAEMPAHFSVASADAAAWRLHADGLRILSPIPVSMDNLNADIAVGRGRRAVSARIAATVQPFARLCPAAPALVSPVPLDLDLQWSHGAGEGWTAALRTVDGTTAGSAHPVEMAFSGATIHFGMPRITATVQGAGRAGTARWQMDGDAIRTAAAGVEADWPSVRAEGELHFGHGPSDGGWRGDARLTSAAPVIGGNGLTGSLEKLELWARFEQSGGGAPMVDGRLHLAGGRLQHGQAPLRVSGIRLDLPYRFPYRTAGGVGHLSIDDIQYAQRRLGNITAQVKQTADAYRFSGTFGSDWFAELSAVVDASVKTGGPDFPQAAFSFRIPTVELPSGGDLGRLVPTAEGMTFSGTVSAQGSTTVSTRGVQGNLELDIQGGLLRIPQHKVEVAGIDLRLHFPELYRLRSGPAQSLRFTRATVGGILVEGGGVDFQIEPGKTLFIEKGRLSWCGGKVDVQSLRLAPGRPEYQLGLYCQRLQLSRILEQLGAVHARGSGSVNGMIPVAFSAGRLGFDDGFLFSTPGESGEIQLTGTEILTRGIPKDTPQFAQVELAREALKDYAYDWAKLGLSTEGEDLVMRLQFDGKPARPLPFVYEKEIGRFVRIEAGAQGSVFQGIGLDVNLRLPLNRLLRYKDIVNLMD